jgi:acylphosphatase
MAIEIIVHGRVQGVYFRASTKDKAISLGVMGWCKNLADGTVFIHAEGSEQALTELVAWCHQGPKLAAVKKVVTEKVDSEGFQRFEIRH